MPGEMKWHRHKIKYLDTTMPVFPLGNVGVAGRYDCPSKVFPSGNIGVVGHYLCSSESLCNAMF